MRPGINFHIQQAALHPCVTNDSTEGADARIFVDVGINLAERAPQHTLIVVREDAQFSDALWP
jgi:hypothetical protein